MAVDPNHRLDPMFGQRFAGDRCLGSVEMARIRRYVASRAFRTIAALKIPDIIRLSSTGGQFMLASLECTQALRLLVNLPIKIQWCPVVEIQTTTRLDGQTRADTTLADRPLVLIVFERRCNGVSGARSWLEPFPYASKSFRVVNLEDVQQCFVYEAYSANKSTFFSLLFAC